MNSLASIKSAPAHIARKMISDNVALAIKSGCGAIVEVTMGRPGHWIVSGEATAVRKSAEVLTLAGMTLASIEDDAELGETFATWLSS